MTRNTITKARIFLAMDLVKTFSVTGKIDRKLATRGREYGICCKNNYESKYYFSGLGTTGRFTWGDSFTHFPTYDAAKQFLKEHKAEITQAAKEEYIRLHGLESPHPSKGFKFTKDTVCIIGWFDVYRDTLTGKDYYSIAEAEKVCKNHLFIQRNRYVGPDTLIDNNLSIFTVEREKDSLLFEFYEIDTKIENNKAIPIVVPHGRNKPFRIYNATKAFFCSYDEKRHKYVDERPLYKDDDAFSTYYYSAGSSNGYYRSADATERYVEEYDTSSCFTNKSFAILKEFGIPVYYFNGYRFNPNVVDHMSDLISAFTSRSNGQLYSSSETQICKDITDFLANIPFDTEHAVVKFRNGYILRLGTIVQAYKITQTLYNGKTRIDLAARPSKDENSVSELVAEQYVEFARLFISNSFSTRSISFATDGGRSWRHDGIHLVDNLFQSNPSETKLGIDVEANNRAALEQLYTIHPKLKYMKKYMELHPDVLYNSCVPFLRALFQYNMILETFIAMKKDDIFWTPETAENNRYRCTYRRNGDDYAKKKETFSMEHFVDILSLKGIPQTGDFYQRLGLTKQQFKLIFADMDKWENVARILFQTYFRIPGTNEKYGRDRGWAYHDKCKFKLVSYEECRLVAEIINRKLDDGEEYYSISNKINNLNEYYQGLQRVHKALVVKHYDWNLLEDYLRMRKQLSESSFPNFKLSIWDMFPDDNEELRRYHDRILFLYNEHDTCKRLIDKLHYHTNIKNPDTGRTYSPAELYLYCSNHGILIPDLANLVATCEEIAEYSDHTVGLSYNLKKLPENVEELETEQVKFNQFKKTFQNLYSMYWGDNNLSRYRGTYEERRAKENWDGQNYREFLTAQLANNLDKDKYDLYLRLRRKFAENADDFDADKYPFQLTEAKQLETLYQELAAKEPELDRIIEERERERQRRFKAEQEAKIATQQNKYVERYKKLKSLNYEEEGEERCVIVPQNLISLIIEGQTLHHCVGSFVDSVSEGKDTIVFLRKVENKETPYVTISLQPDGKQWYIDQAHGDRNSDISTEDVAFLKKWAEAKGIVLSSVKTTYGAHCHH